MEEPLGKSTGGGIFTFSCRSECVLRLVCKLEANAAWYISRATSRYFLHTTSRKPRLIQYGSYRYRQFWVTSLTIYLLLHPDEGSGQFNKYAYLLTYKFSEEEVILIHLSAFSNVLQILPDRRAFFTFSTSASFENVRFWALKIVLKCHKGTLFTDFVIPDIL